VLFPGADTAVRRLAAQWPLAIASGALRAEIVRVLERENLARFFPVLVAAEDVRAGKPAPDAYVRAVELLSSAASTPLDPGDCVAVEDSHWGLESARAAGLRTVAVTHTYPPEALTGAEAVVPHLDRLTVEFLSTFEVKAADRLRIYARHGPPSMKRPDDGTDNSQTAPPRRASTPARHATGPSGDYSIKTAHRSSSRGMCMRLVRSWLVPAVALVAVAGPATAQSTNGTGRFQDQKLSGSTIAPVNIPYVTDTDRKRFEIKLTESITSNMVLGYDAVVGRSRL
jgi:hypothetical protein